MKNLNPTALGHFSPSQATEKKQMNPPYAPAPDVRLQIDVPKDFALMIEDLGAKSGHKTRRETIVAALSLAMWTANEILSGRRVGSLDRSGTNFREVVPLGTSLVAQFVRNAAPEPMATDESAETTTTTASTRRALAPA
jgi:hypothetical protein